MAIVDQREELYDFGRYTFLSCYMPQASRDGMEHRNSTIVAKPKNEVHISISHEFFHAWSVERLRPKTLKKPI